MSLQNARGVQPLSLTTVERENMLAAQKTTGLIVLDSDLEQLLYWDSVEWQPLGGGGAEVSVGDNPPADPEQGNLWWDTVEGRLFIYYTDGNSSQWVDASPGGTGSGGNDPEPAVGVTKLIAGSNVTLDPADGVGNVTISSIDNSTGVGADAWAQIQGSANDGPVIVNAAFNVSSAERVSPGIYRINFATPFPSVGYAVVATEIDAGATGENLCCKTLNYALGSVDIGVFSYQGGSVSPVDPGGISVVVHATNATLPETITMDMWNDIVARVNALEGN